jgi:CspA family cold shock protein
MSSTDGVTSSAQSERVIGRVKWFNNKAGYGFITVTDGSRSGSDVFIHHSAINVESQQYKYLVQGEYVNFDVVRTNSGTHEWQASNVSGVNSGKLMCETRREYKMARTSFRSEGEQEVPMQMRPRGEAPAREISQRGQTVPRARGEGPREGGKREWSVVSAPGDNRGASRPQRRTAAADTK